MSDIAARLQRIIGAHGPQSVGWYMGNPGAFSYSHTLWAKGFLDGLGSAHYYSAGSQDVNNRFAASALLYGSPLLVPIPDLKRTDFLFMVGANPLVSHGSVLSAPRVREQLNAVVDRGGRVVVVDPRRSETARQYEHIAIRPDADAWLLLSMLHVIFDEGLDRPRRDRAQRDAAWRRWPSRRSGFDARAHRAAHRRAGRDACARSRARSRRRRAPPPTGAPAPAWAASARWSRTCSTRSTRSPATSTDPAARSSAARRSRSTRSPRRPASPPTARSHSRIGGFPDVIGNLPATLLPKEITTPGERPDPGVLRVRRQPGAVGARTATRSRRRSSSSTCWCRSTST